MKEFITEQEVELALEVLSDTAEDFAKWKSRARFLELHRKSVRAAQAMKGTAKAMNQNLTAAECSKAYMEITDQLEEALYYSILIEADRNAAESTISAWQTIIKANSKGLM